MAPRMWFPGLSETQPSSRPQPEADMNPEELEMFVKGTRPLILMSADMQPQVSSPLEALTIDTGASIAADYARHTYTGSVGQQMLLLQHADLSSGL